MAFHHLALATTDLAATHCFYTEAMGFELVMVEGAPTEVEGGWMRHVLYDTGDGTLLAIVELHDDRCRDFDPAISTWSRIAELGEPHRVRSRRPRRARRRA